MPTGECEVMGDKLGGIAVHIGDRGVHALKGVPGEWHLFAVGKDRPS